MRDHRKALGTLLVLAAVLSACGGSRATNTDGRDAGNARTSPPVSEQSIPLRQAETSTRTVVHGDTLYSIAWETGRDYRELASWNRISPPYTIKPGQELRVVPPVAEKATATAPAKPAVKNKAASATTSKPANTATKPATTTAATPKPVTKNAGTDKTKTEAPPKKKADPVKTPDSAKVGAWAWPTDGQMLKRYSDNDSGKGIDIGGARGQPVRATANGRVVYQGSGLRGYGQLIIVKHNDEFLSAYAHNDRIYVKEGDVVKRGQKIADMGSTGTDRVKLHFEIRRQGTPIDPLKYLPKR